MMATPFFLALALALLMYWVSNHPSLRPAPPRYSSQSRAASPLLGPMLAMGASGLLLTWPLHNPLIAAICAGVLALMPLWAAHLRAKRRVRDILSATGPALIQLAHICRVRHHPLPALSELLPMLAPPLSVEVEQALAESHAGLPLPDALRRMAARCGDNFYLYQMAELVALHMRSGGDLAASLLRLANRLRTMEELRAEEKAELFGYRWLTQILYGASLLPLVYWAVTDSKQLQVFIAQPAGQVLVVWAILSGFVITLLPHWMAIAD